MAPTNPLPLFEAHGVHFEGFTDDQAYGTCPFTGKSKKFYVNRTTGLWDSKTAGKSGNIPQFLTAIAQTYVDAMTPALLKQLSVDRGLPVDAFHGWSLGWNGQEYTVPAAGIDGVVTDIRFFSPGRKMRSTTGARTNLFGAHRLKEDSTDIVYVCEGEFDTIAWHWALKTVGRVGAVVGVPGAATFKPEWAAILRHRRMFLMYDNDTAGRDGTVMAAERCANTAATIASLQWLSTDPDGWDVRDEVKANSDNALRVRAMVNSLVGRFAPVTITKGMKGAVRAKTVPPKVNGTHHPKAEAHAQDNTFHADPTLRRSAWTKPSITDVEKVFQKWLFLDNTDGLRIMLACVVSQHIDGSPVWVFLVAPPGGSKTEHLNSLSDVANVMMTSSLTTHSLISGANFKNNEDPSLIPQLDGKILVIKDFTAIIGMRDNEKEEIFAILRDAYDGHCGKVFGNGIQRKYDSRFTILGAVTPRIYDLGSSHAALGERFLKFALGDNLEHAAETDIIRRAITNINRETAMRGEMADVVNAFLSRTVDTSKVPVVPENIMSLIIHLAKFGARLRGTVTRDRYRHDVIVSKPSAEVGSRLGVQMAKLGQSLAIVAGRTTVTMEDYRLLRKTMLDTIPQQIEDLVRLMVRACPDPRDSVSVRELELVTRYPSSTIIRMLQDLIALGVVRKDGAGGRNQYALTPYLRDAIAKADLYQTEEEQTRPIHFPVLRAKRKKTPTPGKTHANGPARTPEKRPAGR